jgi:DNA-binding CsgD family transcriptional regulator
LGRRFQQPGIDAFYEAVLTSIRQMQGRMEETVERLERLARAFPAISSTRVMLTVALAYAGRQEDARTMVEQFVAGGFVAQPRDHLAVYNLAMLATACHLLDDRQLAITSYEMLLPHGPYNVRITRIGAGCIGSAQHYLGLLAMTMGRWDDAVDNLEAAVTANTRQGFLPPAIQSSHHLGRALVRRDREGDHRRGRSLIAEAQMAAARFGMRLEPAADQARKVPGADHSLSARELQVAELVAHGLTNPEIAQRLFISKRTAETHVDHIKDKLGISTRAQLVAWILSRERTS